MKYFTIEEWMGYQDLDSYEPGSWVAADRYAAYFESVQHLVPAEYTLLIETVYLHDSRLRHLEVDSRADSALLILDSARGDEACVVAIRYNGLEHFASSSDPDKSLPGPGGYGDLGYDEIEVVEGGLFEHRILFSSGIELMFRFTGITFETQ